MTTANTVNRDEPLAALVALMATALVGSGLPVQSIVGYFLDWQSATSAANMQTPYMCVAPSGTASATHGIGNKKWHSVFVYECITFFREVDNDGGRTEAMLQAEMSLVDKSIRDVIAENRVNANWDFIDFSLGGVAGSGGVLSEQTEIIYSPAQGYRAEMRKIYIRITDR